MKKITYLFCCIFCCICSLISCSDEYTETKGSIYGVVTVASTGEPMRATGVELYIDKSLLLKTVTYDDGHYEFDDLTPGLYTLRVVAEGYETTEYNVTVEAGRTARADMQLKTANTYMTVTTNQPEIKSNRMVVFNGQYTYTNSNSPSEIGFIYGKNADLSLSNGKLVKGEKEYISDRKYLITASANVAESGTWYVMAYAKNDRGYAFGNVIQFEISGLPEVETLSVTNITATTATLNGKVGYEGDPKYTEKGFVYSTSFHTPTVDDPTSATTIVKVSGTSKDFSANISDLTDKTTYYVRAYIKNSDGISYGKTINFSHVPTLPTVETLNVTNLTATSATLNGKVNSEGDPKYTEKGFVYSSSFPNPTVDDPTSATTIVKVSGTSKDFSANISGLKDKTTYYVRAYIKNSDGISYGKTINFSHVPTLPTVETLNVTNLTATSATLNGKVNSEGDPKYTEKGFVYSSSFPNPTVNDPTSATTIIKVSGTSKDFSANISGLKEKTTYYVRAYIKSSEGVSYGNVVSFVYDNSGYLILTSEGLMVQLIDLSSASTWDDANTLCKKSTIGGFTDWRLPNFQECIVLLAYRAQLKFSTSQDYYYWYWTSTAASSTQYYVVDFSDDGYTDYVNKSNTCRVRAVRSIN